MIGPRTVDKPLVLYGAGKLGKLAAEIFDLLGVDYYIIDKDNVHNIAKEDRGKVLVAVCVTTEPYGTLEHFLKERHYDDIVPVWDIVEAYPKIELHNGWFHIKNRESERLFNETREIFSDEISRLHYSQHFLWRASRTEIPVLIQSIKENIHCAWMIPQLKSLIFGDNAEFISNEQAAQFCDIQWDCSLSGIYSRKKLAQTGKLSDSDFFTWKQKRQPFASQIIRAHGEGEELSCLKRDGEVLKKYRQILCVTCYHNEDGLFEVPRFLHETLLHYNFYFRLHAFMGQVAIMYCIPKEMEEGVYGTA